MKEMTMRERILAVVNRRELDRVPFVQYDGLAAFNEEVWSAIGRDQMGLLRWTSVHRVDRPNCRVWSEPFESGGLAARRTFLETPRGRLVQEQLLEPTYGTGATHRHFVQEPEDYDILLSYLEDGTVVEDLAPIEKARSELGEDGVPLVAIERTPFQQLWVQWVNIGNLAWHLVEFPERVQRCVDAMALVQRKIFEIVARAPVDFVDFPDNITAPVIGEANFLRYCVPFYNELADMLAERNVPVYVHMDGDLKPLWKAIGESGVRGLDSMSPPPDNDTSVAAAAAMWPEMRIHINFPSSVHLRSAQGVYEVAMEILQQGGHTGRLEIQISENVPPGAWKTSYPAIAKAIRDFGKP